MNKLFERQWEAFEMTSDLNEIQSIRARLTKLEAQNRRLKLFGFTIFLAVGAVVLMGVGKPASEVVEAQKFVLKDADGNIRAWLGVFGEGSELVLGNKNKQPKMTLKVSDDASDLHFQGSQNSGMNLGLDFSTPAIAMVGANGSGQASLACSKFGPALSVEDAKKFSTIVGTSQASTSTAGKPHQDSAASVVLLDKDKKIIWQTP
jgi:hypothetical protein